MSDRLGATRKPNLDFLTKPGNTEIPELSKAPDASKASESSKTSDHVDNSVKFTFSVSPELAEKLYSEIYHAPKEKGVSIVGSEILEEGLKNRPFKGPAPPEYINRLRLRGKRKKS